MVKFSKIGAAALALALTVTFVAPTPVKAYTVDEYDYYNVDYTTDANGVRTYTNKITKKTWTDDSTSAEKYDAQNVPFTAKNIEVQVNDYATYEIESDFGGYTISDVKIKKGKDVATVKLQGSTSDKDWEYSWFCQTDAQGKHYYYNNDGKRVDVSDEEYAKTTCKAAAVIRIFGKKTGKATIQYNVKDVNGKVIAKKTLKVVVKDEILKIKSVSFAGEKISYERASAADRAKKRLGLGHTNGRQYYTYPDDDSVYYYDFVTKKKSGKFKVTPGAGYKVTAVYVGTENEWITDPDETDGSLIQKKTNNGIAKDTRTDGIEGNDNSTYVWSKLRNGKKITLSKVPAYKKNRKTSDYEASNESNYSTTRVRVVVQNKKTKEFSVSTYNIACIIKK